MKILLISLLRLGDILLHRELAKTIKRQYPGCELHFLIYSQFQSVRALVPEVDRWILLDRKSLERTLVERNQSPLMAYAELEKTVSQINSNQFAMVLNATHNKFSVRLMDLLSAQEKRGVALECGRKVPSRNNWQTYLNEHFSDLKGSRFHYLEVLQKSLGLDCQLPARSEDRKPGVILLQLLTSDVKKNWGLHRFHELKRRLEQSFPEHRVLGLCSPQEKSAVEKVFAWNEFVTPDLSEAKELLKEARLLVTGDTSIQHLASQVDCPIVSLFLGSADPVKTAPWQMGAWVIQGKASCAPCAHSGPCHQSRHLCADSVSVESVFELVSGLLRRSPVQISNNRVAQTENLQGHFSVTLTEEKFDLQLEQLVWSSYLNGSILFDESFQSTASLEMLERMQTENNRFQLQVNQLKQNKINIENVESEFPQWKDSLTRFKRDGQSLEETQNLIEIRREILTRLHQQKEVSYHGNTRYDTEEHFAQT
jgi:ADP-heptose:LPS heptosyltransferase